MEQTSTISDLTSDQIVRIATKSVAEQDGYEGDPPIPTPDDLVDYFQDKHAEALWTALNEHSKKLMNKCHAFMRNRAQEIVASIPKDTPPNDWTDEQFTAYLYQRNETRVDPNYFIMHLSNDELENQYSKYSQEALLVLKAQTIFQEDTAHAIEALHHAWKIARELDNSIKHPPSKHG